MNLKCKTSFINNIKKLLSTKQTAVKKLKEQDNNETLNNFIINFSKSF